MNYDKQLNILTEGIIIKYANSDCQCYMPTPYEVIEAIVDGGYLMTDDTLVDFGCGRGRVTFYLSHTTGCRAVGIEKFPKIYDRAMRNLEDYTGDLDKVSFVCKDAVEYDIGDANAFFFFNPFSAETLEVVMENIMQSFRENPRKMKVFFYYRGNGYEDVWERYREMRISEVLDFSVGKEDDERRKLWIFEIG